MLTHRGLWPECRTASPSRTVEHPPPLPRRDPPLSQAQTTPQQLKKALIAAGFEVFRTLSNEIVLAERVRENLILDSGVRVGPNGDGRLRVRVIFRAQRADFPHEEELVLFDRVRKLAEPAQNDGFSEISTAVTAVKDPADATKTLDTFYEVFMARDVASIEDAVPVVKFALGLEKSVSSGP